MFTATPINARKRGRPVQYHGQPATQPSQPLRPILNGANHHNNANGGSPKPHSSRANGVVRQPGNEDTSLIPQSPPKWPSNGSASTDLRRRVFRNTPKPPRTTLLPEHEVVEEEEDDDDDEEAEEEQEDEEDDDEYTVPLLPPHEYQNDSDVDKYENEYSRISRRLRDEDDGDDESEEEDEDGGVNWLVTSVQDFITRIFTIGVKMGSMLIGPFFNRHLWWVVALLLVSFLSIWGLMYGIYCAAGAWSYKPPMAAPENMDDVVMRLMAVERELASVSRLSNSLSAGMQDNYKEHQDKFLKLDNELDEAARGIHTVSKELARLSTNVLDYDEKATHIGDELSTLQKSLSQLQTVVATQSADQTELYAATTDQNNTLSYHIAAVKSIESTIDSLRKRITSLEEAELGEQAALELIDKYLPPRLAVMIDPKTRKLTISPEFWDYLQGVIAKHYPETSPDQTTTTQPPDWDEFLRMNEQAIRAMVDNQLSDSTAFVTKQEFENLIGEKLAEQRHSVTDQVDKLNRKIELYGENTQSEAPTQYALEQLVRQQIAAYTSNELNDKPDFAHGKQGAKIDYAHTSGTHDPTYHRSWAYKAERSFLGAFGFGRITIHDPEVALNDDVTFGSCWAFNGKQGQLAVDLADECFVSDLAIYHPPYKSNLNYKAAPRNVTFWAHVGEDASAMERMGFTARSDGYIKLVGGQVNVKDNGSGLHVFHVPMGIRNQRLRTSNLLVTFDENWGKDEYTCIYRVRVYGDRVEEDLEPVNLNTNEASFGDDEVL